MLNSSDNVVQESTALFNSYIEELQYASNVLKANQSVKKIRISLIYENNINFALFDDIQFYFENNGAIYSYYSDNKLSKIENNDKSVVNYSYGTPYRLLTLEKVTDVFGNEKTTKYSYNGYRLKETEHSKSVDENSAHDTKTKTEYVYTSKGNIDIVKTSVSYWDTTTIVTKDVSYTDYDYSADERFLTTVKDTFGATVNYIYDEYTGELKSTTDPYLTGTGDITSYTYDTMGAMSSVSGKATVDNQPKTISNTYGYKNDKLDSITHNDFSYNFEYDNFNRVTKVKVMNSGSTIATLASYTYNTTNGNINTLRYENGQYETYVYDEDDNISGVKLNGSSTQAYEWTYSPQGLVASEVDSINNVTRRYEYDYANRIKQVSDTNGNSVRYNYGNISPSSNMILSSTGVNKRNAIFRYGYNPKTNVYDSFYDTNRLNNIYDHLGRLDTRKLDLSTPSDMYTIYEYEIVSGRETSRVKRLTNTKRDSAGKIISTLSQYSYTYDAKGNILTVNKGGVRQQAYHYDEQGQLLREGNRDINNTVLYIYDDGGNLKQKRYYPYTQDGTLTGQPSTVVYQYDSQWKDKLISYNGKSITYDAIGNPLEYYNGRTFTWTQGRMLATVKTSAGTNIGSYAYNSDGLRTKKTVGSKTTEYFWVGDQILTQHTTDGTEKVIYWYDENGSIIGLIYNGTKYYYEKNLQGDIIALLDVNLNQVAKYTYDTWGKLISIKNASGADVTNNTSHTGYKNPIRYRGYYYDNETGFYYLQSRYYDPEICRFINADSAAVLGVEQGSIVQYNLFAY